ncbi:hypothetical protein [Frigoriglobus tundricola]|uniref:Uncharacterized protein n=1 Tax=Frigoriglobus tundricola TaxID=2774151 RepID=A0A6M5YUU6_9BACT|nr:hypothetical protein [Frigoriglobus tundricola]QJW97186.1 hypothetical protein FTUN_4751 [Frigoriglobus tundricola]
MKELKYPPVGPTEEPQVVRFQAMKEMSEAAEDVVLDYAPLGETGGERRAMAVVVRKDLFNAIQAMSQAAGLKLAGVTPRPYAVAAGLVKAFAAGTLPPPEDRGAAFAALTLGPGGGEFTVVGRGEVTYTLAVPAPVVASETMLVAQIRRNLAVYAGQHAGHPIEALYLAEVGGPWAARLRSALGVPVHAYDPLAGAVPTLSEEYRGRFAGAAGLLAGKAADTLPINFAVPRQPVVAKDPAKQKLVAAALIAFMFLFVGGAFGYVKVTDGEANVARLEQEKTELAEKVEKGKASITRADALDAWAKREVVWLDEIHDLAARMPADDSVRVSSLNAEPIRPDKNGKQDAQARLELKLAAVNTGAANTLASTFGRANVGSNPYYVGTTLTTAPPPPGNSKHSQGWTFVTKVNQRAPGLYAPSPPFVPVRRTGGSAGGSIAAVEKPLDQGPPPSVPGL